MRRVRRRLARRRSPSVPPRRSMPAARRTRSAPPRSGPFSTPATGSERITTEWRELFLIESGSPRQTLITQGGAEARPRGAQAILEAEQKRVIAFRERFKSITVATGTASLLRLGSTLLAYYAEAKKARALLDYDDLILKTGELLRARGQRVVGALQARRRHRPRAGGRGAGHLARAVGRGRVAVRRVLRRARRAGAAADRVRGRRRQAVDLQLPGRRPGRLRADAGAFRDAAPAPPARSSTACRWRCRSAPAPPCSKRWTPSSTPTSRATASPATTSPSSATARSAPPPAAWSSCGRRRRRRRTIPAIRGTRRSTMPARRARPCSSRAASPASSGTCSTAARSWSRAAVRSSPAISSSSSAAATRSSPRWCAR